MEKLMKFFSLLVLGALLLNAACGQTDVGSDAQDAQQQQQALLLPVGAGSEAATGLAPFMYWAPRSNAIATGFRFGAVTLENDALRYDLPGTPAAETRIGDIFAMAATFFVSTSLQIPEGLIDGPAEQDIVLATNHFIVWKRPNAEDLAGLGEWAAALPSGYSCAVCGTDGVSLIASDCATHVAELRNYHTDWEGCDPLR